MKLSTQRVLSFLGTASLFIGALVIYALLLSPAYADLNKTRGELYARQQIFTEQSAIIQKVKDLIAQYQGTARIQDTVSLTLPTEPEAGSIVSQLQSIAGASGIVLQSLSLQAQALRPAPDSKKEANSLGVVEINANLVGPYEGLKNFLQGVETNIRLMNVSNIRAEILNRNTPNNLSYTVIIDAYYQAE